MPETPEQIEQAKIALDLNDQRIVGYCEECSCSVVWAEEKYWCLCLNLGQSAWREGWVRER